MKGHGIEQTHNCGVLNRHTANTPGNAESKRIDSHGTDSLSFSQGCEPNRIAGQQDSDRTLGDAHDDGRGITRGDRVNERRAISEGSHLDTSVHTYYRRTNYRVAQRRARYGVPKTILGDSAQSGCGLKSVETDSIGGDYNTRHPLGDSDQYGIRRSRR